MPTPPQQPPATTRDFEYLLSKRNVVAVDYDPADNTVRAWVSQKVSPVDLSPDDLVANNVPDAFDSDVLDVGYGDERDGFDPADIGPEPQDLDPDAITPDAPASERQQRHRPVEGGLSECHRDGTAATGGLLASVTDPTAGAWDSNVPRGALVRVSNNHVYANTNQADFGDPVFQPSPYDGGSDADTVGALAGYVPLDSGVDVDVAARLAAPDADGLGAYAMPNVGTGVMRSGYNRLQDVRVRKGGRTTGITDGRITALNATVNVAYRNESIGDDGVVRMPNQMLATDMSGGGDSGSHVFVAPDAEGIDASEQGALIGELYAGSDRVTVVNKAGVVERKLGVRYMPENIETFDADVQVAMATPDVRLVETTVPDADGDAAPDVGEEVTLTCTVESSYQLPVWLQAVGPDGKTRAEATPSDEDETADGTYVFDVDVSVAAPAVYRTEFSVMVTGGYRLDDEHLGDG